MANNTTVTPVTLPLRDRAEAGRLLGAALEVHRGPDLLVLALPRGGVCVAAEVARVLESALDLMIVRKLGVPPHPELAMGAIGSGGVRVMNQDVIEALGIGPDVVDAVAEREQRELERRERVYRGARAPLCLRGRTVLLVDDGLATGATMRAAVRAAAAQQPAALLAAVPVATVAARDALLGEVDELTCLATPAHFGVVGRWYQSFPQISDAEVRGLLGAAWHRGAMNQEPPTEARVTP
jgi:putative phosphoribosyl transferase